MGRKREVQPEDYLGLVLVWTQTTGLLYVLQLLVCVYLRFGVRLFVEMFRDNLLT
jgi:hypothetical protein